MQKFTMSIFINAPKEKVWKTLFDKDTYEQWTKPFNPTSHFVGDWGEGSKMIFLGTDENGEHEGGMVSRIAESRPYDYLSIEHVGLIEDGVEDTTSEKVRALAPSFENYTLTEKDGGTELVMDQDIEEEHAAMFHEMWPKALEILKELAEN